MKQTCFIFGLGYTATFFSEKLVELGFNVVGTTRAPQKKSHGTSPSMTLIDFESEEIEHYLSQSTHILISIPPKAGSGDLVLLHYAKWIKRFSSTIQWIGYLSSTGVYGDHQGLWVDENSLCKPTAGSSGHMRLEAENAWLAFAKANELPLHIFRLAGIYGQGRNALERVQSGKKVSIFKEGQVFSRIHVSDIVNVLVASIKQVHPLSIYNVADDAPEASHVVDVFATTLLKRLPLPVIPIEDASLSSMEQEFYSSNRRVSNAKIKREFSQVLQYPTYREGLSQIWEEDFNRQGEKMSGFKDFIMRGNVIDLAVAVIIGAAFSGIVDSMTKDIITPVIGLLGGEPNFSYLKIGPIGIGNFINAIISFLIKAAVVYFAIIKPFTAVMKMLPGVAVKKPEPPAEVKLLQEIRDILKAKE